MNKYAFIFNFLLLTIVSYSQKPTTIVVNVVDNKTQKPIEGASVFVDLYSTPKFTDSLGVVGFPVSIKDDTRVLIIVSSDKYIVHKKSYSINKDNPSQNVKRISLIPEADSEYIIYGEFFNDDGQNLRGGQMELKINDDSYNIKIDSSGNYSVRINEDKFKNAKENLIFKVTRSEKGCETQRISIPIPFGTRYLKNDFVCFCKTRDGKLLVKKNELNKKLNIRVVDTKTKRDLKNLEVIILSEYMDSVFSYPYEYSVDLNTSVIHINKEGYIPIELDLNKIELKKDRRFWRKVKKITPFISTAGIGLGALFQNISRKKYERHLNFEESDDVRLGFKNEADKFNDYAIVSHITGGVALGMFVISLKF
jgi:hypothetical protein